MLVLHYRHLDQTAQSKRLEYRAQSEAAHRLLQEILQELRLPITPLQKAEKGRPALEGQPTVDFNLAHTEGLAICALYQRKEAPPPRVGVDVEARTAYTEKKICDFAMRFFGKWEQRYVLTASDKAEAFTRVFVRKESFAKYRGDGLGAHLSKSDTLAPDFEKQEQVRFLAYREQNFFISLCLPSYCTETPVSLEHIASQSKSDSDPV